MSASIALATALLLAAPPVDRGESTPPAPDLSLREPPSAQRGDPQQRLEVRGGLIARLRALDPH